MAVALSTAVSNGKQNDIKAIINSGVVPKLIDLIKCDNISVREESMTLIATLAASDSADDKREVTKGDTLQSVADIFRSHQSSQKLLEEATRFVANLLYKGTSAHVAQVIEADILPSLIAVCNKQNYRLLENELLKQAACTFHNYCDIGTSDQIVYMVQQGVIPLISKLLICHDDETLEWTVKATMKILKTDTLNQSSSAAGQLFELTDGGRLLVRVGNRLPKTKADVDAIMTEYFRETGTDSSTSSSAASSADDLSTTSTADLVMQHDVGAQAPQLVVHDPVTPVTPPSSASDEEWEQPSPVQ